jgi:6-pyruvoyltetrahydropterin/6-carboxytetrahydropterin synthase
MPQSIIDAVPTLDKGFSSGNFQCIRRVQFCAGHRVWNHESKCAHLHGHNYVAFFHATADALDSLERVIDFSELKSRLGGWIDSHWDHGFILNRDDREAIDAVRAIPGQKLYLIKGNPTAENLAHYLLQCVARSQLRGSGVDIVKVVLWETENCYAEVAA